MDDLETYECFGVPAHAWAPAPELAALVLPARAFRHVIAPEVDFLGIEATPSPLLAEFAQHG
ncbi:MAG TPA: hypothetical protein VFE23_19200 [Usitatibacter sp.]|jgi:hypothetical protein|nr:hypothetical protein [Usitatibacter sp.]